MLTSVLSEHGVEGKASATARAVAVVACFSLFNLSIHDRGGLFGCSRHISVSIQLAIGRWHVRKIWLRPWTI